MSIPLVNEVITHIFKAVREDSIDVLQVRFPNWAQQTSQDLLFILNALNGDGKTALEIVISEKKFGICEYLLEKILHNDYIQDYSMEDKFQITMLILKYCQELDTNSALECWSQFEDAFNMLLNAIKTFESLPANLQKENQMQILVSQPNIIFALQFGALITKHILETPITDERRNNQLGIMKKMYFLLSILFIQQPLSPEVQKKLNQCLYRYILLNHQHHPASSLLHRATELYDNPNVDLSENSENWSLHVIHQDILTLAIINLLISLGADAHFLNVKGFTPLHILAEKSVWASNNYLAVFKAIVEVGHLDQRARNGETAISILKRHHEIYRDWSQNYNIQPFDTGLNEWINIVLPLTCLSANINKEESSLPIEEEEMLIPNMKSFQLLHRSINARLE